MLDRINKLLCILGFKMHNAEFQKSFDVHWVSSTIFFYPYFMKTKGYKVLFERGTNEDEMCNFYIMYWSEKGQLELKSCGSAGPPYY